MATINYPYYQPQQVYQPSPVRPIYAEPQPQLGIKGRPVSSIEEVRATSIDFDGSIFFFPDLANKRIYTKQINIDGTSTLNIYELQNQPPEPSPSIYITREEFEQALAQINEKMAPKPATTNVVPASTPITTQF